MQDDDVTQDPGPSPFSSNDPEDIAWRRKQMEIDNDIAGLARDPAIERLIAAWDADGIPTEQQIAWLRAYFSEHSPEPKDEVLTFPNPGSRPY